MEKYIKIITCPVRESMFIQIKEICEKKDIPISIFIRKALKLQIDEELKNG
jgi:hypothetical protein